VSIALSSLLFAGVTKSSYPSTCVMAVLLASSGAVAGLGAARFDRPVDVSLAC